MLMLQEDMRLRNLKAKNREMIGSNENLDTFAIGSHQFKQSLKPVCVGEEIDVCLIKNVHDPEPGGLNRATASGSYRAHAARGVTDQ
jgi:hypothetical protein